jgi:hypothetical protein
MASKRNCPNEEIVFLSATASQKPKSNKLGDFVAKNVNTNLDVLIKKEKVFEVLNYFFLSLF